MSNDQMRKNEGKPRLSYYASTLLALYVSEGAYKEPEDHESSEAGYYADTLRHGLVSWLNGKISHTEMTDIWLESAACLGLALGAGYSEVCVFGEVKYARGNFRKGSTVCSYADSALRHLGAVTNQGELNDAESGKPHLMHAFWNWVQIFEIMQQPEVAQVRDDRLLHQGNLSGGVVALTPPAA